MTAVFVGGSRRLSRMNAELLQRLENITKKHLSVLVGDANGFDRVAQVYFAEQNYPAVTVYCTAGKCRNNIGAWSVRAVEFVGPGGGRNFYTAKDDAMLRDAQFGLFAWDAKSAGTLRNIRKMAELRKPSVVYVSTLKKCFDVRNTEDVLALMQAVPLTAPTMPDLFVEH
jgi:hypothetical protein